MTGHVHVFVLCATEKLHALVMGAGFESSNTDEINHRRLWIPTGMGVTQRPLDARRIFYSSFTAIIELTLDSSDVDITSVTLTARDFGPVTAATAVGETTAQLLPSSVVGAGRFQCLQIFVRVPNLGTAIHGI